MYTMKKSACFFAIFFMTISLYSQIEPLDTDGNGYRNISTLENLRWVSENESCWGEKFELDNDIDAKKTKKWNDGKGWSPIGTKDKPFTGVFDGKGHSIIKLTIDRTEEDSYYHRCIYKDAAMFGHINGNNAQILNLSLLKCEIEGGENTAGLAVNVSGATITNCKVTGYIESSFFLSGFIYSADSATITKCYSNCKMRGSNVAGFIIIAESSTIQYCSARSEIKFVSYASGFISNLTNSKISECSSNGNILYKPRFWALHEDDPVFGRIATGFVIHNLVDVEIKNCFSTCNIKGRGSIAGFAKLNQGSIEKCYSTGLLKNKSDNVELTAGFILGDFYNNVGGAWNIFWDKGNAKSEFSDDWIGKTTAEMKTKSTYTDAGWDFDTIWAIKPGINDGYPYLRNVEIDY